jgi:predicted RNA binding protein YcfA (HicA-like mRNA interferase family)
MARFPVVTSREMVRVLTSLGFRLSRQAGTSHAVFVRDADKRRTVVPMHAARALKRRTVAAIMKDAGLDVEQLRRLLRA